MNERTYDKYIVDILSFLNNNFPEPEHFFNDGLSKINYYTTKYFVQLPPDLSKKMDEILRSEIQKNPVLDVDTIPNQISVIKHDITQIKADAIVNAANSDGLGCFEYNHKCIDNIIHSKAGPNLRLECKAILNGGKLRPSMAIITKGYNLPAKNVIHVVGPIYDQDKYIECATQLVKSYIHCLTLANAHGIKSIVFCCISTGVYKFPKDLASQIAVSAVKNFLRKSRIPIKIVFCTYTDEDYELYKSLVH